MLTSIIRTIIGTKFQLNPSIINLFSGSGPTPPPPPRQLAKSQNAVGYKVKSLLYVSNYYAMVRFQ